MTVSNKNRALKYFALFSNKDVSHISFILSHEVKLRDWELSVEGNREVVKAMQQLFDEVDSIAVHPLALYEDGNVVVAELEIIINNKDKLLVTDILTFSETGTITEIRAYKG